MGFPTPSIYTYRVVQVIARNHNHRQGYWLTEYSTDGSTWSPLHPQAFDSDNDAFEALGLVVGAESGFRDIVNGGPTTSSLNPERSILAYPPS